MVTPTQRRDMTGMPSHPTMGNRTNQRETMAYRTTACSMMNRKTRERGSPHMNMGMERTGKMPWSGIECLSRYPAQGHPTREMHSKESEIVCFFFVPIF